MLYVVGYSAYLLFDSRATHSFIMLYVTKHVGLVATPLEKLLEVSSALEKKTFVDSVMRGCVILIGDYELPTDLVVLDLRE